jgi:transcriptional regulator with PAS, ATPase and Fis domain
VSQYPAVERIADIRGDRTKQSFDSLIGASPAMDAIRAEIEYAGRSGAKVLLTGESGVGKEVVARLIHQNSARAQTPLVTINCGGIPESLLESELFGHVRGSFTGAYRDRIGLLEMAHKGTVFFDEVCEMSLRMQVLLLRFLESGEIQRVGSDRIQAAMDVRVIAASNRDPLELMAAKAFREDLYYRLNVVDIKIPPLRARREDIPALLDHFLQTYCERHGVARPAISPDARKYIVGYEWPGNVRQLKNVVERLVLRARGSVVTAAHLPPEIVGHFPPVVTSTSEPAGNAVVETLFDRMVRRRESFWSVVYPAFMSREVTRSDVRFIISKGLQRTAGSYKLLVELFSMPPTDYKRFLSFLSKHQCHMPFHNFRVVRRRAPEADSASEAADTQTDPQPATPHSFGN